jgi:hypothetical protein
MHVRVLQIEPNSSSLIWSPCSKYGPRSSLAS